MEKTANWRLQKLPCFLFGISRRQLCSISPAPCRNATISAIAAWWESPGMCYHGRLQASAALAQQALMLTHSFMITVALHGRRVETEKPSREEMAEWTQGSQDRCGWDMQTSNAVEKRKYMSSSGHVTLTALKELWKTARFPPMWDPWEGPMPKHIQATLTGELFFGFCAWSQEARR